MKLNLPSPIQKVVGIVNWKLGPEVLPKSPVLLAASLCAFAVAMFLRQMMDYSLARSAASGIGAAAVLSAAAYIGASVSGYRERLTQNSLRARAGGCRGRFCHGFATILAGRIPGLCGYLGARAPLYQCYGTGEFSAVPAFRLECFRLCRAVPAVLSPERSGVLCDCNTVGDDRRFFRADRLPVPVICGKTLGITRLTLDLGLQRLA